MRTDVTLEQPGRALVIDAKFYREPLQEYYGRQTVRSSHLYQLFAYLRNFEAHGRPADEVEGMLLYPQASRKLNLAYCIHGHRIRVCTVNLNQPWRDLHKFLLSLIAPPAL
jgi:5-methylcytosine-specific restriction enzyme subunit McrC